MTFQKPTKQQLLLLISILLLCPANAILSSSSYSILLPKSAVGHKKKLNQRPSFLQKNDNAKFQIIEQCRGGALFPSSKSNNNNDNDSEISSKSSRNNKNAVKSIITITSIITFATLTYQNRSTIQTTFFNREKFRKAILTTLNHIASRGNTGIFLYAIGFTFWECCGLPTSVVETAAGMAFGFRGGLIGSFIGKTCGSLLAFTLGRTLLSSVVGTKMEENDVFGLVERGVQRHPIKSSLIVRYSPFPQLIKNFALSLTKPVSFPIFLMAICIHGFPFSLLWAALGNDSSMRLRASEMGESMPVNVVLNSVLVFVTVFGFVVSPAITGWWLADLRNES